jgi:hypothetical protein
VVCIGLITRTKPKILIVSDLVGNSSLRWAAWEFSGDARAEGVSVEQDDSVVKERWALRRCAARPGAENPDLLDSKIPRGQ